MTKPTPKKLPTGLLWAAAITALVAGALLGTRLFLPADRTPPAGLNATLLPEPRALEPFQLMDHDGGDFSNANLKGHWNLLFFGYTHCPDVCPTTLSQLNAMVKQLERDHPEHPPARVLFVTVDPQRDTREQLSRFVPYFNENFTGITGDPAAIEAFTRMLGVLYVHSKEKDASGGYIVDHTASVFLLDPAGRMAALFSPPHDAGKLAEDYIRITRYFGN